MVKEFKKDGFLLLEILTSLIIFSLFLFIGMNFLDSIAKKVMASDLKIQSFNTLKNIENVFCCFGFEAAQDFILKNVQNKTFDISISRLANLGPTLNFEAAVIKINWNCFNQANELLTPIFRLKNQIKFNPLFEEKQ